MEYYEGCWLAAYGSSSNVPFIFQTRIYNKSKTKGSQQKLIFIEEKPITQKGLFEYLNIRCIDFYTAKKYFVEIWFDYIKNLDGNPNYQPRRQYALASKNDSGGYEFRNSVFKGFLGNGNDKTITSNNLRSGEDLVIFEGRMNFVSFICDKQRYDLQCGELTLNSVNNINRAMEALEGYQFRNIYYFLDNDESGRNATQQLIRRIEESDTINAESHRDKCSIYEGFNDYNEYWVAKSKSGK